ncbi:hypothetical protein C8258_07195 [Nocardia sp. MDA0666]|nr:hypothetical protein C8258_07195 [Nocardia sp. MDA0666]
MPAAAEPAPANADPVAAPTEPVAAEPVPPSADPVSAEPDAAEPAAADPTAAEPDPRMLANPANPSPTTGVGVIGGPAGPDTCAGACVEELVEELVARPGMARLPSYRSSSVGDPAAPGSGAVGPCCPAAPAPPVFGRETAGFC